MYVTANRVHMMSPLSTPSTVGVYRGRYNINPCMYPFIDYLRSYRAFSTRIT